MKYVVEPSLEHIALVKVAVTLWNQTDFQSVMDISTRKEKWEKIKNKVMEKVSKLQLPVQIKAVLLGFIEPIGSVMFEFLNYDIGNYCFTKKLLNEVYWTELGIIDMQKTALKLVQDENLDIVQRYKFACTYCLENYVHTLWKALSGEQFYGKNLIKIGSRETFLVSFWSYYADGKIDKMEYSISVYEWAFEIAVLYHDEVAIRYFLQKLAPEEKKRIVDNAVDIAKYYSSSYRDTTILCCFLSALTEEQETEVFKRSPMGVFRHLLEWPWYDLFIPTLERMWNFISKEMCYDLFIRIVYKFDTNYCNYRNIFGVFWKQSPEVYKKFIINKFISEETILHRLINTADKENICLILMYATVEEKQKIFFNYGKKKCEHLIRDCEWNLLEFFIQECISSKDMLITFKQHMNEYVNSLALCVSCKLKIFEPFLQSVFPPKKIQKISPHCNIEKRNNWSLFFKLLDCYIEKVEM